MTTTLPNRIIKYFVDTSNPSQSGFYFYEKAGTGGFVRLGALADASRAGGNTFEIDSSTAENVIYNGLGGADTYVVRSNLDKNIEISDPHTGDDGSGNEAKNTIVFDSDVTVTSISSNQVTRLEEADILRIELTLDTGAVITVNGPDVFQYVVGGAAALDFAGFIAAYGDSGIAPANRAPVIESGLFASIDENVDGSAAPVSVGQVAASDADASDTLTYSIVNAVDQNGGSVTGFEVDGAGLITYVGTGLDAETITSVALTVSASDGEDSAQTSVAIAVTNIDEGNARFVVTSDGDITAAAVGDVLTVGTRSADPDGNDAFTYQWYRDGADIADATGASYTIPEDYNRNSIYVVVRYTDGSGTNEVVTLSGIIAPAPVDNVATAVALDVDDAFRGLWENADTSVRTKIADIVLTDADGGNTGTPELAGRHADMFEIVGNGLYLKAGASLDYESVNRLNLRVHLAEDSTVGANVSITLGNIDEGNASFAVTSDGDLNAAVAGDVLTVGSISADPDGNGAFTYQWYRDGAEIADATGASYTIPEDYNRDSIYVVVRYTDGSGTNEVVTLSGIIVPVPEDNADRDTPAAPPATPAILNVADLDPATTGFRVTGGNVSDHMSYDVSSVGDINGDDIDDFAIGVPLADPNGGRSGATYIIYGQADGFNANIDLTNLNVGDGFRISGEKGSDFSGVAISGGDINGDGFNDIIIGAHHAEPNEVDDRYYNSGSTYVVFGKAGGYSGTVNLSSIVANGDGFRLDGENRNDWSGEYVSAGDINGDGYDDVIIGAYWFGYNGDGGHIGSTYVVFGKPDNPDESNDLNGIMSLSTLDGSDGFRIDGGGPVDWSGRYVSSGDVNGDGYDDIIIGGRYLGQHGGKSGTAYVVFGRATDANDSSDFDAIMQLSGLDGSNGFRIDGLNYHDLSGLSSAGDINGDGNDDIIVGVKNLTLNGWTGASYIVFGKANDASGASNFDANVQLSELDGSDGFRIEGTNTYDWSGDSVSSAGDFNGDGFDDVIIGAHGAESNGVSNSGSTYIVFGKETGFSDTIRLADLDGSDGVRIDGAHRAYHGGNAVSSAGDVNDDGYDDVIIGASGDGPTGSGYIVYGYATSATDADENTDTVTPANIIVKYFVDTSNPSESGFYFYEVAGDDNLVRLDRAHEGTLSGDDTFEIDSPTAELVIYAGFGGADTYVIRGRLDNDVQIHDIDYGDDGSGNEVKNTIVFASDVTVTSIYQDKLQGRADVIKIEQTLDTDAVVTVHVPDAFEYVVGGAAALDFAEFIATYGASGISATNRAPVFENEPTDLSIDENADGSAAPVSVGRVVASDADAGDTLTYSIVSTADQNGDSVTGFEVDGTGLITYVGTGLDAETITSVALTVSASDGQESAQTLVAISVTNIDEGNASFVVTSNDDITAAVAGDVLTVALRFSDPDGDGTFSYQWYRDGVDIAGATGASYTITEADGGNSLYVAVRYTDGSGADEIVTASGIIIPVPSDNIAPATPAVLNLADLDPTVGFRLIGEDDDFGDSFGSAVSSVGDINGDGHDDFAIGANLADPNGYGRYKSGSTYVVFGKESDFSGAIDLSELDGSDGFRIDGEGEFKRSGYSVSASDINGDGYNDIIIGAPGNGGYSGGATYVVFGKESGFSGTVDLSNIVRSGSGGVRIDVENADPFDGTSYWSGRSVSAGDINGDGYDDVIIGAWGADPNEYYARGSTYVVFGRSDGSNGLSGTIDLSELDGSDGFRIDGENANDKSGLSVSAGDVNGDGYDDIIIGAPGTEPNVGNFPHYYDSGSTYVVFGKEGRFDATIELSDIVASDGSDGFRINGESASDRSGFSVSSAGDINGDGYDDIIIGARYAGPNGDESGASYVVFGNDDDAFAATMNLSELDGSDGFRINGESARDGSGYSVSSAGDFNGDGYDDVIIGARYADPNGHASGSTYVVFGKESGFSRVIELSELDGGDGFRIDGENTGDQSGRSVSSAGDVNGDGYDDIIIGAPRTDGVAGYSYVIYGHATSVTNIDEGNASFVVTSDRDINAAVAGDVLTVALRTSDPDGDGTFTYQWYRDGVDIAGATGASYTIPEDYDGNSIYVVVRYTDGSGTDETITASGVIVPVLADNDDDASEDPVNTTYTMMQAPTGVSLTRGGVALSVGETFTYQDIQGGSVALTVNDENALSGLRLTTDDGTDANPAEISLDIEVREVADIAAPEAGNDLDYSENEGSLVIDTGDYGDQITAAQGSDFITGGLGDDTINLEPIEGRETGQDTVVYNFGSGSIFTATDGGDDITGFKRGEDIFLLKTESDNPELATLDGLLSYVSGPDKGSSHDDVMIVTPNYVFGPEDGGNNIVVTGITGITLHFEDAGTYGGGYLAKGHVSITFDEQLDWAEFLSLIEIDNGDGTVDENFNYGRGLIRDLSALPNLMGEGSLAYEVEAPAQTPPQDVDVPLEDDIPATSFDVV